MPKVYSDEFVKSSLESMGYTFLSRVYINNIKMIQYVCPKGHKHNARISHWLKGIRCPYCSKKAKPTYEFVKAEFEKNGYKLLSKTYINHRHPLRYICPNGHTHSTNWHRWKHNHRCPSCSGNTKPEIDFIRKQFEAEKYVLLSSEYINNKSTLKTICPKGHEHNTNWDTFSRGHRCMKCKIENMRGKGHFRWGHRKDIEPIKLIRLALEKEGYTLLSDKYQSSDGKLDCLCDKGHPYKTSLTAWFYGHRCHYCNGGNSPTIEFVKNSFEKEGYTLLTTEYVVGKKLEYICPFNHKHKKYWCDWQKGTRCPTCSNIRQAMIMSGENAPNWRGGISLGEYCDAWNDKDYKEDIKKRDGYKCLNPCCSKTHKKRLNIHHIDYDKQNCSPSNLITVCVSCNAKANNNRSWHRDWYSAIMYNRYGYRYDQTNS